MGTGPKENTGTLVGGVAGALIGSQIGGGPGERVAAGVAGALIGGFVGELIFDQEIHFGWDLGPFLLAVAGAIGLLLLLEAMGRRRGSRW
jgi:uncharacterized membrane protein YeaQ/YmgE (transglycosylase-associated protein family)